MTADGFRRIALGLDGAIEQAHQGHPDFRVGGRINWGGGNNFHMLEHLETIACFDDPAIAQKPPSAPIDTLIGVGTGRYNGVDGYRIEFTRAIVDCLTRSAQAE